MRSRPAARLRRTGLTLATVAALTVGPAITFLGATPAAAAAVDYDCDNALQPGPEPGTLIGDEFCTPQAGDPTQPVHIYSVYYGEEWICDRVVQRPDGIIAYGCVPA